MKTEIRTIANSLNGSFDSTKHTVKVSTSENVTRWVFEDLTEARIFMLNKACELLNNGLKEEDLKIIPYTN